MQISCKLAADRAKSSDYLQSLTYLWDPPPPHGFHKTCSILSKLTSLNNNTTQLSKSIFLLKCIWNEIFDNDFIGPFENAFKDKTIAVYRLLISGLDHERLKLLKLWISE